MMINIIASQPDVAPASATSAETNQSDDFSTLLDTQLAAATEDIAPEALIEAENKHGDSDKPDEADAAALWLASVGLNSAAGMVDKAAAPPISQLPYAGSALTSDGNASLILTSSATPQTAHHSAVTGGLPMMVSPQAEPVTGTSAERPTPGAHTDNPAVLVKSAISTLQARENENAPDALRVKPATQAASLIAAPVLSPASLATPAAATPTVNAMLPVAHATLEPDVGSPAWRQALGQQLSSFTRNGIHHAELRLHPEHLGPLKINLRLHQDQVQLHFITEQQPVRAALEAAMPHLRSALAESGIQLDQGSVGSDASAWGSASDSHSDRPSSSQQEGNASSLMDVEEDVAPQMIHSGTGINIFA